MEKQWSEHRNEITILRDENQQMKRRMKLVEQQNRNMHDRIKKLEDSKFERNVIFQGIRESTWESDENRREKVAVALTELVNRETYEECLGIARNIPISNIRRLGAYNPLKTRPISVEFTCKADVEYLMENKRNLKRGIYVEREYGPETEKNRRLLRPIFNSAR